MFKIIILIILLFISSCKEQTDECEYKKIKGISKVESGIIYVLFEDGTTKGLKEATATYPGAIVKLCKESTREDSGSTSSNNYFKYRMLSNPNMGMGRGGF